MAATVVSVVIFLCGVLVGRGVKAERTALTSDAGTATRHPGAPPLPPPAPRKRRPPMSNPPPRLRRPSGRQVQLHQSARGRASQGNAEDAARRPATAAALPIPAPKAARCRPPAAAPKGTEAGTEARTEGPRRPARGRCGAATGDGYAIQVAALREPGEADTIAKRLVIERLRRVRAHAAWRHAERLSRAEWARSRPAGTPNRPPRSCNRKNSSSPGSLADAFDRLHAGGSRLPAGRVRPYSVRADQPRSSSRPSFRRTPSGTEISSRWPPSGIEATGGRVSLTVFGGGSQGDEPTVLRKMRLDALQAASLTGVGLGTHRRVVQRLRRAVLLRVLRRAERGHRQADARDQQSASTAKGFVLLNWGHGGWTQLFTKKPITTVADLKKAKLYTSAGNDRMVQWFKANGFEPRAMAMTDIMTGLTTGMVEAVPTHAARGAVVPVVSADAEHARHRPRARRRRDRHHAEGLERHARGRPAEAARAAAGVQKRLQDDVPKQDAAAVAEMTKRGLAVTQASAPEWRA